MRERAQLNLGPRYRALTLLAKGGMGAVYLGERVPEDRTKQGQLVAIKVMHGFIADQPSTVALFIDEARIGTRIVHPNVVRVIDTDVAEDTPFLVMEYIEGLSLASLLRRAGTSGPGVVLPQPAVARIVHDVLLGLSAAHAIGAVHRDVSPHNVLVGVDGRARITDFGVATFTGRLSATAPGEVRGKLGYMAPEQVTRAGSDGRIDVFAAGIVLWEALTGQPLFEAEMQAETLANVLGAPIDPPSSFVDVSEALEDVCLKALERDRERRYASADAFAEALAQAVTLATPEAITALVTSVGAEALAEQREARDVLGASIFSVLDDVLDDAGTPTSLDPNRLGASETLTAVASTAQPPTQPSLPGPVPPGVSAEALAPEPEPEADPPPRSFVGRGLLIAVGAIFLLVLGTALGRMSGGPAERAAPSVSGLADSVPTVPPPPVAPGASAVVGAAPAVVEAAPVASAKPGTRGPPRAHAASPQRRPSGAASASAGKREGPFVPAEL